MSGSAVTYLGGPIFDGERVLEDHAACFRDGRLADIVPRSALETGHRQVDLGGDLLSPGYVDLQVNGGDGVMFNDDPSVATLARIAAAHRRLGAVRILPTLITDTPEKTHAAIGAAIDALAAGVPGIAGLHLEGPHLSVSRKGAHDAALIRPMEEGDLLALIRAADVLPALMVTVAPESVALEQIETLAKAGVIVSLGHSDADFDTCVACVKSGASCVTHLFNAMSQLGHRNPGLVGAALSCGEVSAGLIGDGVHVHPAAMRAAWDAKAAPGKLFLVSDAMAVAGTELQEFRLGGRLIRRQDGRLTLTDGTLAGADLDLTTAIRTLKSSSGLSLAPLLASATIVPARLIGLHRDRRAFLQRPPADFIRIRPDLSGAEPIAEVPPAGHVGRPAERS